MKRQSLVDEIITAMEDYLKRIDNGEDGHFKQGVLKNNRGAARYAIANMIGHAKALKESRYWERVDKQKKLKRKGKK